MPATPVDPFWDKRAYLQIADDVVQRIDTGEITFKLPGERTMAEEYESSVMTVRHALEVLRERSKIATFHGRGSYVASELPERRIGHGDPPAAGRPGRPGTD